MHKVQSFEINEVIHKCAETDHALKCKIGQNDLVAYEAHYHKNCKRKAVRRCTVATTDSSDSSKEDPKKAAFTKLVTIIDQGLKNGHVYSMDEVCSKYCQFLAMAGDNYPSCRSHRLKGKLSSYFGNSILQKTEEHETATTSFP